MSAYIVPKRTYISTVIALYILLVATVGANELHLGHHWSIVVALAIAVLKALLVVLYFMHVRYSQPLTRVAVVAGFFWLFIMIGGTLADFISRGWLTGRAEPF